MNTRYRTFSFLLHILICMLTIHRGSTKVPESDATYWIRKLPLQVQGRIRQQPHGTTENEQVQGQESKSFIDKSSSNRLLVHRQNIYPFGWPDIFGDKRAPIFVGRRLVTANKDGANYDADITYSNDIWYNDNVSLDGEDYAEDKSDLSSISEENEFDTANPDFTFGSYKFYKNMEKSVMPKQTVMRQAGANLAHWREKRDAHPTENNDSLYAAGQEFLRNAADLDYEVEKSHYQIDTLNENPKKVEEIPSKFQEIQSKETTLLAEKQQSSPVKKFPTHQLEVDEKRAPKFVGKREENEVSRLDSDKSLLKFEDNYDKRKAPSFVGKRMAPRFVGKRRVPGFVGKRRVPGFVGKRMSHDTVESLEELQLLEKRRVPGFVGKRRVPGFVEKRMSNDIIESMEELQLLDKRLVPGFVEKRRVPGFVGKRKAPGFVGKRPAPEVDDKRRAPSFVGKRLGQFDDQQRLEEGHLVHNPEFLKVADKRPAPAFVGK